MRKQAGPASIEVAELTKWAKVSANKEAIVVGFFTDYSSGNGKIFMQVADALRDDFRFAHVTDPAITAAANQSPDKVVLYRPRAMKNKFEDSDIIFDGEKFTG